MICSSQHVVILYKQTRQVCAANTNTQAVIGANAHRDLHIMQDLCVIKLDVLKRCVCATAACPRRKLAQATGWTAKEVSIQLKVTMTCLLAVICAASALLLLSQTRAGTLLVCLTNQQFVPI